MMLSVMPENDIRLPWGVSMSYETVDEGEQMIKDKRITGYFKGDINHFPEDQVINPENYT